MQYREIYKSRIKWQTMSTHGMRYRDPILNMSVSVLLSTDSTLYKKYNSSRKYTFWWRCFRAIHVLCNRRYTIWCAWTYFRSRKTGQAKPYNSHAGMKIASGWYVFVSAYQQIRCQRNIPWNNIILRRTFWTSAARTHSTQNYGSTDMILPYRAYSIRQLVKI